MRIFYGVQGTGNGHLTRARVLAQAFSKTDTQVDYLFSGRASADYFDMRPFGDYQTRAGLSFSSKGGKIQYIATATKNSFGQFWRDVCRLDLSGYDLVLTDFEPISAWAAKRQGLPCIGISHQNAFLQPVPLAGDSLINQMVMKYFAPAQVNIGCHWHHFECDVLPPIIEAIPQTMEQHGRVLVYLPFEDAERVATLLSQLPHQRFVVFHGAAPLRLSANVDWYGFGRDEFQQALAGCSGVIASAGFGLASEALVLGKKLLLKPLHGQFEQLSNALALELLGAATVMKQLQLSQIEHWLQQGDTEPVVYPPVGELLVEWLLAGNWNEVSELCQRSWQQCQLPETWLHKWATPY